MDINMLTKDLLKKLLYLYLIAIVIVALYFIAKRIFHEEKPVEYKNFNTPSERPATQIESSQAKEESPRFMLLPQR